MHCHVGDERGLDAFHGRAKMRAPLMTAVLDPTDAALVRELQEDGRVSLQALADRVGLSRTAVRARVQHLFDAGVVRVVGIVHPAVAGLTAVAHVSVTVQGPARGVVDAIAGRDAATYVSLVAGEHSIIVDLRARDDAALEDELDWIRGLAGVTRVNVVRCAGLVKDAYSVQRSFRRVALDDVDWRLLEELQRDGRASYARLAERVALSQAATRARVVRLIESGTVHVTGLVDSSALGVREGAGLGLRVQGAARVVAEQLAELPGVHYVLTGFGRFDVIVGADAASRGTLVDTFELVRGLPGVLEVEAWQHLAIVKESYAVDLAAVAAANGAPRG
jgi:DNA-binding Lrp family transcriptional regulator